MHYNGVERRKYQRFKVAIPVNIGMIALNRERSFSGKFKGVTTDISIEGLGIEVSYPASGMFPFGIIMIGENREFNLQLTVRLGPKEVSGVGEVRWISTHSSSGLKMGIFLKEMGDEKKKWTDFVISQNRGSSQDVS
jgi:hypothetical protein